MTIIFAVLLAAIVGGIVGYMIRRPKQVEVRFDRHSHYLVGQFLGMIKNESDPRMVQSHLNSAIHYQMHIEREMCAGQPFVELDEVDLEIKRCMIWNMLDDFDLDDFISFRNAVVHLHLDEHGHWVCDSYPGVFRKPKSNMERMADACERVLGDRAIIERPSTGLIRLTKKPGDDSTFH